MNWTTHIGWVLGFISSAEYVKRQRQAAFEDATTTDILPATIAHFDSRLDDERFAVLLFLLAIAVLIYAAEYGPIFP